MANVSSVTKHFITAQEGFVTTTSGTVSAGAGTVGLNSVAGYTDGDQVALVIDPNDPTKKQVFTGEIDTAGVQVTGVVWTEGDDVSHATGATVVDYTTATHQAALVKGMKVSHEDDGSLKTSAVQDALDIDTSGGDWSVLGTVPTLTTTNGNRSFGLSFGGIDYTDRLSKGMRLRIPRTGTTPTQSADLDTNRYASRTAGSVSGVSVSTVATIEAWVYVKAHTGFNATVLSRFTNAASGWTFGCDATGSVRLMFDTAATSADIILSSSAVPTGKWVHIAATINTTGASGKTWIDGVEVTATYSNGTTGSTSNTAALAIGGTAEPGDQVNMRIADVRLWSTTRTDAEIKDNMNQQLTGSETGLMGYWKLNGDFNDSTANANHLTGQNGAVATYAEHPFKATEYAWIRTTPTYSGGNTTMTVWTGKDNQIPNQTLGTASYTGNLSAYGMPDDLRNSDIVIKNNGAFARNTTNTTAAEAPSIIRQGNLLQVVLYITNTSIIADTQTIMGQVDLASLGITSLAVDTFTVGQADGGNTYSMMTLKNNGLVYILDTRPTDLAAGSATGVTFVAMIDSSAI